MSVGRICLPPIYVKTQSPLEEQHRGMQRPFPGLLGVPRCTGPASMWATVLRETLKLLAHHNAESLGLIPDLVFTPEWEQPFSHTLRNCIFSIQLHDEVGRDESEGESGSHGRAEDETLEGLSRAETKSQCRPIWAKLAPRQHHCLISWNILPRPSWQKKKQRKKRPFCNAIKPQLPICFCPLKELITW